MPRIRIQLSLAVALLAGCSGDVHHDQPGPDHPAHPTAAPSPPPAPSEALHDHATTSAQTAAALYACPMHPDVTSTNPNDLCPKCHMKINKAVKPSPATRPGGQQ